MSMCAGRADQARRLILSPSNILKDLALALRLRLHLHPRQLLHQQLRQGPVSRRARAQHRIRVREEAND